MEYAVMALPAKCKKCGGPVFSMEFLPQSGLCVGCARIEAARKMSLTLE
jgi:hypothetical protein